MLLKRGKDFPKCDLPAEQPCLRATKRDRKINESPALTLARMSKIDLKLMKWGASTDSGRTYLVCGTSDMCCVKNKKKMRSE